MASEQRGKHFAKGPSEELVASELVASEPHQHRFGIIMKVFGILMIIMGVQNVCTYTFVTLIVGLGAAVGWIGEHFSTVTTVVFVAASVLHAILAVFQLTLGIRLLRSKNRGVALACRAMIGLHALLIVCDLMVEGLTQNVFNSVISMLVLGALQTYSDPTLRQERLRDREQTKLQNKADQEAGTLGRDKTGRGYLRIDFFNVFWIFVVTCVIGLVLEVIWHMTVVDPGHYQDRAGLLYGPFSPIYGFGAVLITVMLNRFWRSNVVVQFVAAAVIGASFEFAVSYWMEFSFGITAWDYSNYTLPLLNVPDPIAVAAGGRTSTMFLLIWGTLGIVWIRLLLPILLKVINLIPWNWRYGVTAVCTALMILDCGLTVSSYDCWYQRQAGTMEGKQQTAIDRFCNDHYDDAFMEHRFQSMSMDPSKAARV